MATNQNSNKDKEVKKTTAKKTTSTAKTTAVKKPASTAAKTTAAKKTTATAAKATATKKTASAAAKTTTAKKTTATAAKTTTAKKTTATAAKTTAAKKTTAPATKTAAAKKTALTATKTTAAKKPASAAAKTTAAKKPASATAKTTAAKKTTATAAKTTAAKKTTASAEPKATVLPEVADENFFEANLEKSVEIEVPAVEKTTSVFESSVEKEKGPRTIISEYKEEASEPYSLVSEKETETLFQGLTQVNAQRTVEKKNKPKNKTVIAIAVAACLVIIFTLVGISKCSSSSAKKLNYNELTIDEAMTEAKKLINEKKYAEALRILSSRDIVGTDKVASGVRSKINSLMTEAVCGARDNGKEAEVLSLADELRSESKYAEDLRMLSFGKSEGYEPAAVDFQKALDSEKKQTVDKMVAEGRTQEVIDLAKKMIANGQYAEAFELLDLLDLNDELNAEYADLIEQLKVEALQKAIEEGKVEDFLKLADKYAAAGNFDLYDYILKNGLENLDEEKAQELKKKIKELKKQSIDRAVAEGRIDEVLAYAEKLLKDGDYAGSLELLNMIDVKGDDPASVELRNKINDLKKNTIKKAIEEGRSDEIIDLVKEMIDSGDSVGAIELLSIMEETGGKNLDKSLKNQIKNLKKDAVEHAIADGKEEELLELAEKFIKNGNASQALDLLSEVEKKGNLSSDPKLKEKISKLEKDAKVAKEAEGLSDSEKLDLARKMIKEGRYEDALRLLNSMDENNDDVKKLKKSAVDTAKKKGINLLDAGFDEDGNPILSPEELAKKQEEAKIAAEREAAAKAAAEKKAREEAEKIAKIKKLIAEGKFDEAQKLLNSMDKDSPEAKKIKKQLDDAKIDQAKKLIAEGKFDEAEKLLNSMDSSNPAVKNLKNQAAEEKKIKQEQDKKKADSEKNRALAEEAIERGKKLLAAGDIEGAMKEFNKAKELLANEDDENYKAEKLGEIARALEEEAEKLRESDPTAASLASSNALVFASNALSLNAEDPNALFVQGMAEMTKRNYPAAERCFRKAAAKDPSNSINYYQLGRALFMQKKFAEAENAFKSSVKLDGTFSNAYYNLGVTQTKLNKTSDALSSYKNAYRIKPDYENAVMGAASCYLSLEKYNDAIATYGEALKINPSNAVAYEQIGSCYASTKNYVKAEENFKKALECATKDSDKALTNYNLSSVMFEQQKKEEALSYAKKAYDSKLSVASSAKVNIVYNYALMNQENGNLTAAENLYKEVFTYDKTHVKANTNLGILYLDKDDADGAIEYLETAYASKKNFEICNGLGNAYNKKENYEQATKYYAEALKDPSITAEQKTEVQTSINKINILLKNKNILENM